MIFSKILANKFMSDMGRYAVGDDGSLFGFSIRKTYTSLNVLRKWPVASMALYNLVIDKPVGYGVCFNISWDILWGPVALLFIWFRNMAVSWIEMGFVSKYCLSRLFRLTVALFFL